MELLGILHINFITSALYNLIAIRKFNTVARLATLFLMAR